MAMLLLLISTKAESKVSLNGDAQLTYITYSATFDKSNPLYTNTSGNSDEEQISRHGSSFVQKYAAALTATNVTMDRQRQYYNLMLGYDWKQFNTKGTENDSTSTYKGSSGNFRLTGKAVYDPAHLPVALTLFSYNGKTHTELMNIFSNEIINDNLATGTESGGKSSGWGGTFIFLPERTNNLSLRGLPRLHIDYAERNTVLPDQSSDKTRELAVAGLSKENNWINYRFLQYEHNYLGTTSGHNEQAIQVGLVDYQRRRKWSALTNWINISADGQLITRNTLLTDESSEEYDLNFFAIATRKKWRAISFLNYNRRIDQISINQGESVEKFRIPLSLKGTWGRETDWFFSVSADNSLKKENGLRKYTYSSNSLSLGGTTFKSSSFNFSPALSFTSNKFDNGAYAYNASLTLGTSSNRQFSNIWNVSAASISRYKDNGTANGVSWNQSFMLKTFYKPTPAIRYLFGEDIQLGSGRDFVNLGNQTTTGLTGNTLGSRPTDNGNGIADYLRSITTASFAWSKSASLTTSFDGSYDVVSKNSTLDAITKLTHKFSYNKKSSVFSLDTIYVFRNDNGDRSSEFNNTGQFQYRPDNRNEGMLNYSFTRTTSNDYAATGYELTQRYSLNFFTKTGVLRNLATVNEEVSYRNQSTTTQGSNAIYSFTLAGRYYPTSKTALYASVKSQSGYGILTLIYTASASAEFKLLSTSIDYTSAKRDIDHRTERRIATSIRRSF